MDEGHETTIVPSESTSERDVDGPLSSRCPVCGVAYDSRSVHGSGLLVNLLDNERYRRVCFDPAMNEDGDPVVRFYHHTHAQTTLDGSAYS